MLAHPARTTEFQDYMTERKRHIRKYVHRRGVQHVKRHTLGLIVCVLSVASLCNARAVRHGRLHLTFTAPFPVYPLSPVSLALCVEILESPSTSRILDKPNDPISHIPQTIVAQNHLGQSKLSS